MKKIEQYFVGLLLIVITFILFANVILRFFGSSLEWAEEVARYGIIWVTFIGGSVCIYKGGHISVDAISFLLSNKVKKLLEMVVIIFSIVFVGILTLQSSKLALRANQMNQLSSTLEVPMALVYLAMPIGGILMILRYLQKIIICIKEMKGGNL